MTKAQKLQKTTYINGFYFYYFTGVGPPQRFDA